jgi:alpha-glucuronidase
MEYQPKIEAEDARLDAKHGIDRSMGIDFFAENSIARRFEENEVETELHARLMECDEDTLLKIMALYYYGRDRDGSTYAETLNYFRGREQKEGIVRTIMEKQPAWQHEFGIAIAALRNEDLDLDKI